MPTLRHIPHVTFSKGTWRNGRGVSWDIASDQPFGSQDFGWRFAVAEIAASGSFSQYEGVDRIFTLIDGDGVDLQFGDGTSLAVHQRFVPHSFSCGIATECTLRGTTSKALNLFTMRNCFQAGVVAMDVQGLVNLREVASLLYVLQGEVHCEGVRLVQGDAMQIESGHTCEVTGKAAKLYVAKLKALSP